MWKLREVYSNREKSGGSEGGDGRGHETKEFGLDKLPPSLLTFRRFSR
jgi:hypothetical protein